MSIIAHIVLLSWVPAIFAMFMFMPPRRAVIASFVVGWLFLPMLGYSIEGLPDFNKASATAVGVLLAALVFDSRTVLSFRPHLIDLPMLGWCLCPFASSLSNGFGWYGGLSISFPMFVIWGIPYFIGRVYFRTPWSIHELGIGIILGALIYVPLIFFEARLSWRLDLLVYGKQTSVTSRMYNVFGIFPYMPRVFLQNPLAVTMYMAVASVIAFAMVIGGAVHKLVSLPGKWIVCFLMAGTVVSKSLGANLLMLGGGCGLWVVARFRSYLVLFLILLGPPTYIILRCSGLWSGDTLVRAVSTFATAERCGSLVIRQFYEDRIVGRALERPLFGWAGWGLAYKYRDERTGEETSAVPDGLWVIALGQRGVIGLALLWLCFIVPPVRFLLGVPSTSAMKPQNAGTMGIVVLVLIYSADCLFNAMLNPLYMLAIGGLSGVCLDLVRPGRDRRIVSRGPAVLVKAKPPEYRATNRDV